MGRSSSSDDSIRRFSNRAIDANGTELIRRAPNGQAETTQIAEAKCSRKCLRVFPVAPGAPSAYRTPTGVPQTSLRADAQLPRARGCGRSCPPGGFVLIPDRAPDALFLCANAPL